MYDPDKYAKIQSHYKRQGQKVKIKKYADPSFRSKQQYEEGKRELLRSMGKNPTLYFNRTADDTIKGSEASHRFSSTSSHGSNSARRQTKLKRMKSSSSCEDDKSKEAESVVFQDRSENSDHLPFYYNTQNYEKVGSKGQRVYESKEESDAKYWLRMKDFHRVLGQYNICVLPEPKEKFQDGIPTFNLFTGDCSRKGKAVRK